jgi:hypothetical protein
VKTLNEKNIELFVRIPLQNIELEDPYEQSKLEEMKLTDPVRAIHYLEEAIKETILTVSFHQ